MVLDSNSRSSELHPAGKDTLIPKLNRSSKRENFLRYEAALLVDYLFCVLLSCIFSVISWITTTKFPEREVGVRAKTILQITAIY